MMRLATPQLKLTAAVALTLFTCNQGLLMEGSKRGGRYPYNSATAEFIKLVLSAVALARGMHRDPRGTHITLDWRSAALFPIPSALYVVHNNMQFHTMAYVDASTYSILGNLKIVTTGVFFYLLLNQPLRRTQWIALLLLTMGATTSQIGGCGGEAALSAPMMGYALGVASAVLSGVAGVYTEFLLKRNTDSLLWQNCQLYGWGVLFNCLNLSLADARARWAHGSWLRNGLAGYSGVTWAIVANFAFSGLLVSWLQKYADTIVKVFATTTAMLLSALLSVAFFGLSPSLQLFIGIAIVGCSLHLYYVPEGPLPLSVLAAGTPGVGGGTRGADAVCPQCRAPLVLMMVAGGGDGAGGGKGVPGAASAYATRGGAAGSPTGGGMHAAGGGGDGGSSAAMEAGVLVRRHHHAAGGPGGAARSLGGAIAAGAGSGGGGALTAAGALGPAAGAAAD